MGWAVLVFSNSSTAGRHHGILALVLNILILGCSRTTEPAQAPASEPSRSSGVYFSGIESAADVSSFVGDPWTSLGGGISRVVFALWSDGFLIVSSDIVKGGDQLVSAQCDPESVRSTINALKKNVNLCRELAPHGVVTDEPFSELVVWDGTQASGYSSQHEFRSGFSCASLNCAHRATEAWLDAHYRSKELVLELLRGCSETKPLDSKAVTVKLLR